MEQVDVQECNISTQCCKRGCKNDKRCISTNEIIRSSYVLSYRDYINKQKAKGLPSLSLFEFVYKEALRAYISELFVDKETQLAI